MSEDASIYLAELLKQKDTIVAALDEMASGTVPNMTNIEQDVAAICGAIEIAPPSIARQTEAELRSMISLLEDLAGRIEDFQFALKAK
jgi:hypothetical protein